MSLIKEAERCLANRATYATLNAFISPLHTPPSWRERVAEAEARRERGQLKSRLDGKLIAIKDNICTQEPSTTTCASRILDTFTSPYNATVVQRLEDAGAVIAGKTNMDEFGMGSHSTNSHFGRVVNPVNANIEPVSAGGSSGGSAIAVATDQCYAALGTDTGGSVRLPASYTGIFGFKPSYGLLSRWGVVAYANSLDTVGIFGKTVPTIRDVFQTLNHHDPHDPTSLSPNTRSRLLSSSSSSPKQSLRIGVPLEYNISELSPSVRTAWLKTLHTLQSNGHTLHPISLPNTRHALSSYYVLAPAEASSNLAKYDGVRYGTRDTSKPDTEGGVLYAKTRGDGFGEEVKRRIVLGAFTLSADAIDNYFIQAQKVRRLVQKDFNAAFSRPNPLLDEVQGQGQGQGEGEGHDTTTVMRKEGSEKVDVLVCPTAPTLPPTLRSLETQSPLQAYVNDVFTVPSSLAGLPSLSVPVPVQGPEAEESGVSTTGMQVIGQFGDDQLVLDIGEMIHETGRLTDSGH